MMTDILIAGAGLAGLASAIHLSRRGFSVELFERGEFPREKPCGEGLMPAGVAALERLRMGAPVEGAPFRGIRYHCAGRVAEGRFPQVRGLPAMGRGCRRRDLDHALFSAAAQSPGVTAYTGMRVEAPQVENGRVVGIMVEGALRRGRLVIAADGSRSRLRHALGLDVPMHPKRVAVRAHFRLAPGQPGSEWVDIYVGLGYELYVTPLKEGELLVAALAHADVLRGNIEGQFRIWCDAMPDLAHRLHDARQITELQAVSPLSGRARRRSVPGLLFLGDAAGFSDPLTGGGMTQALLAAELLARMIGDPDLADSWVAEFDRKRERLLRDYRRLTAAMLWLAHHPMLMRQTMGGLQRCPALFSHLIGVAGGMRRLWGGTFKRADGGGDNNCSQAKMALQAPMRGRRDGIHGRD